MATAEWDRDAPVAFDPGGRRILLDPNHPPATPVIALGRAETKFLEPGLASTLCETCFDPGSGGGAAPPPTGTGLYMTYAKFAQTFEGWLKGDPEFEVHILGQSGTSNVMTSYQCAGDGGRAYRSLRTGQPGARCALSQSAPTRTGSATERRSGIVPRMMTCCVIKTDRAVDRMFRRS